MKLVFKALLALSTFLVLSLVGSLSSSSFVLGRTVQKRHHKHMRRYLSPEEIDQQNLDKQKDLLQDSIDAQQINIDKQKETESQQHKLEQYLASLQIGKEDKYGPTTGPVPWDFLDHLLVGDADDSDDDCDHDTDSPVDASLADGETKQTDYPELMGEFQSEQHVQQQPETDYSGSSEDDGQQDSGDDDSQSDYEQDYGNEDDETEPESNYQRGSGKSKSKTQDDTTDDTEQKAPKHKTDYSGKNDDGNGETSEGNDGGHNSGDDHQQDNGKDDQDPNPMPKPAHKSPPSDDTDDTSGAPPPSPPKHSSSEYDHRPLLDEKSPEPRHSKNKGSNALNLGTMTGRASFYDAGMGACGFTNDNSDMIVAVSSDVFAKLSPDGNSNANPLCKKWIKITYHNKTVRAMIADECPSCPKTSLDLSPAVFNKLANPDVGLLYGITWYLDS